MIWLYDNIDMRIEGRIIVRDISNPPHAGFEHRAAVASGWIVNRKFYSVFASIFASPHLLLQPHFPSLILEQGTKMLINLPPSSVGL